MECREREAEGGLTQVGEGEGDEREGVSVCGELAGMRTNRLITVWEAPLPVWQTIYQITGLFRV